MATIIQMLQYCNTNNMTEQARGILQAWYLSAHEAACDYADEIAIGNQLNHLQSFIPNLMEA